MTRLQIIKSVHTIVWAFFVGLILHVLYAGWADAISAFTWTAVALVCLEGLILLMNDGRCPLTTLAERHGDPDTENFDIFLPEWLARHNITIFTSVFFFGLALIIYRIMT